MSKRKNENQGSPDKAVKSRKSEKTSLEESNIDEREFVVEVKTLLRNKATLLSGLNKLRDVLKSKEPRSFAVFKEFIRENSECPEVYKVLEKGRQQQTPLELQIALEILENILLFTAEDPSSFGQAGMYHVRRILHNHLKLIYSCLNPTCHFNMIKGALRLLVAMVTQGVSAAREVVAVFDFTLKALGSLVNKRDLKTSEDIRTCFIHFVMSFLMYGDDATIRHVLDIKGFASSIFKLFPSDSPDVVNLVLTVLHQKVVQNNTIPKKTKVQLFSSFVLTKLASLYDYNKEENTEEDEKEQDERQTIKERIHKMLRDICCTFKFGICFANKMGMFSGRSNNPVLLRFLQSLPKHDQNLHLRQLIIQVLTCCPDLVQPYLSSQSTTYEPRLSLPWLTNMNFITKLYSALPSPSDMIEKSSIRLMEESVQSVLNTVLPSVLTRANLNQGIQHSSLLVKNTTLSLLVLIMNRAYNLLHYCEKGNKSTIAPQSSLGLSFVEMFREALLRALPDVKTIISLRQNLVASKMLKDKKQEEGEDVDMEDGLIKSENAASPSLLLARVLQTLHFYQKIQPNIFATTAFDLGKLLPGQQEMIDRIFTPIVQHYTLEILSDLPRGMFKWYQQKSKNGPSYMYSVLKMFVQTSNNMIRNKAKNLIIKFLQDTGIMTQDLTEVDTWLKCLNMPSFEHHRETLLMFLDLVCHTVAMEPYTYTDVVMEMTSETKARQANGEKFSLMLNVDDNLLGGNFESRVAFSPLIVKALMAHTQMVSAIQDKYTNDQLCSVAQYINVVILDVLRNTRNPLPLILTVKRFYGNEVISVDSASLKTTHQSLLSYVDTWIGDCTSTKIRPDSIVPASCHGCRHVMVDNSDALHVHSCDTAAALYWVTDKACLFSNLARNFTFKASNPSQEKLVSFLSDLNEAQLKHAVGPCVKLCVLKHSGDLRPLVDLLMVKPCCITGSTNEDMFPLLKQIPFANLLWQVFGPLLKTVSVNGYFEGENQGTRNISRDNKVFLLVQHPGIQTYLVDSLLKEDLSTLPRLCNNLLQYLSAFVSQATKSFKKQDDSSRQGNESRCQGDKSDSKGTSNILMSVVTLLFLLIDAMIERFETFESANKSDISVNRNSKQSFIMTTESILGEIQTSNSQNVDEFQVIESEQHYQQIQEDFLKTLLQNPVLFNCFLNKFDSEESTASAAVWSSLTSCIGDLLQGIVDKIQSGTQRKLLKPYTRKICEKVVGLVAKATVNDDISPDGPALQALQLLQVFSPFCDQSSLSEPIAKLLELPFEALVKKSPNRVEPTIYLQTLFALLDPQANHVTQSSNQGSDQNDVIKRQMTSLPNQGSSLVDIDNMFSHMIDVSNQKAALFSTVDFVKVTKLLPEVPSKQLDQIVLKLLRKTPRYILEVDPYLLDHCLDYVTEDRVSIATILIASSASLRVHFEQRCTSRSGVRQLSLRDHHWDLLPVVHWYFSFAESTGALSSENNVVSYLSDTYWPYLWNWIREPKKNTNRTQDLSCAVLKFLVIIRSHDIKDTRKLFSKLLDLIPSQSWDVYQMTIIRMMLDLLLKNCTNENKQSVLVGSAVSVCMVNISLMLQLNSDDKSLITGAVSMLLDILSTHTGCLLHGEDSLVEVETWSTFVKNCLKYRFDCAMTLQCMTACLKPLYNSTKHKTLTREFPLTTMYQLILSHSKFLEILLENDEESKLKESLLDLVVAIAELCPECCEASHLPVFFGSYNATLRKTDQSILYLLHLYERAQVPLSSFRPYLWGKAALEHHKIKKIQGPSLWQQPSTNEVLELLDVTTLNRSALDFPKERKLRPRVQNDVAAKDKHSSLYDPCFILPLFCHLLSQNSVVDCRKFVERGGLGYTVSALSSRDEHMRKAASHVLSRCLLHMDAASFREKKQVYLLLESLKNGITDVNVRVSSVITRFVSRAAYVMLHPESQMYVLVNSFLLQRAVMDLREVPLFYTLFNSSSLQHRNERMWILQLLVEGLRDAQDYYVYKKRHVMELAMSYHDSQMSDQQSRKLVITLVKAALSIHSAAFDLAKNYAIVGWIHSLCLASPNDAERLSTSLRLLHTLWFTIQQGKPGTCNEVDSSDVPNSTPYPPNLCGESLLVCKTLIKLNSSSSSLNDLPMLLELLGSVLGHIRQTQTATEGSHLSHQEVLQLISLWCILYNEFQVLSALNQEVQLTGQEAGTQTSSKDEKSISTKQNSLELLLDIISLWRPTLILGKEPGSEITNDGVSMLACSFGLHFASSICQTVDQSDKSLLKLVTWFRYCIASSASLQKSLLSHLGEPCLTRILFLYGCTSGVNINLVQELGMIFLVLLSRVQHMHNDALGRTASEVVKLLSSDVYQEVMKSGVEEILFPLCPSPLMDETAENVDVEVTQLVSAFLKDLWFIHPVPTHFLTLASINNNPVSSNLLNVFKNGSTKLKGIIRSLKKKGANG